MMTIKKIYWIVLLFSICIFSCSSDRIKIDERILNEMSKGGEGVPLLYGNTFVFVSAQNSNEKIMTSLNQLQLAYDRDKDHYEDFYFFLQDALNQKIKFDKNDFKKGEADGFVLSENIQEEYNKNDILFLRNKYLDEEGKTLLTKQNRLPINDLYSVLYLLFIHGYKIGYDDYLGEFSVKKW